MSTSHRAAYDMRTYPGYLETLISVQQEYKTLHISGTLASVKTKSNKRYYRNIDKKEKIHGRETITGNDR